MFENSLLHEEHEGVSMSESSSTGRLWDESTVDTDIFEADELGNDIGTGGLVSGNRFRLGLEEDCLEVGVGAGS